jgi:hypothetical protein
MYFINKIKKLGSFLPVLESATDEGWEDGIKTDAKTYELEQFGGVYNEDVK